jgi:hypothetical protein
VVGRRFLPPSVGGRSFVDNLLKEVARALWPEILCAILPQC